METSTKTTSRAIEANIKYSWGFPASLLVQKEGRTVRLKFLEDLQDFCKNLDIPVPNVPR